MKSKAPPGPSGGAKQGGEGSMQQDHSNATPGVADMLPLETREYATISVKDSREVFADKRLWGKWGALYVEDARGRSWTVLGDHAFCRALRAIEKPSDVFVRGRIPGPLDHISLPSDRGVAGAVLAEFPIDEFRPVWIIAGWPDEWRGLGRIEALAWSAALSAWGAA